MKKVMFLCHGAGNGGAEKVITTLANEFANRNYTVSMVTTNEDKNDYVIDERIQRMRIVSDKGNPIFRTFDRVRKLRRYVKENSFDCIVSFSAVPNMQVLAATFGLKCGKIISERTDPNRYPASKIGKLLRKILYKCADRIVFQTKDAKSYFSKSLQKKSLIIPNPISPNLPDRFEGERDLKIVGVGSLGEQKNWQVALAAAEKFFEKHPSYKFDIYGEGPDRNSLQAIIDNSELLCRRVTLKGFSSTVLQEVQTAKMYVSSSRYEGISNAMLEALAIGTPAICTDCPVGGAKQFIEPYVNGILVPVDDSEALFRAMDEIAEDSELCERLSAASVKIKQQLQLNIIADMWESEVKRVCEQG